jgi:hypothetical protein
MNHNIYLSLFGAFILAVALDNIPTTTTSEQDRKTFAQRTISFIWETTQAIVAISITFAMIYAALNKIESAPLTNSFFLIVGFYFSRTNHTKVGTVGYEGR